MCRTYDYRVMPVVQNVYDFFCSGFWLIYGVLGGIVELIVPNVFMEVINLAGVVLYLVFRWKNQRNGDGMSPGKAGGGEEKPDIELVSAKDPQGSFGGNK